MDPQVRAFLERLAVFTPSKTSCFSDYNQGWRDGRDSVNEANAETAKALLSSQRLT